MEATLNIRIDSTLKKRGELVLRKNGISASAAVRALWEELAATKDIPSFMQDVKKRQNDEEKRNKRRLLKNGSGVAKGSLSNMTDKELREALYADYR